MGASERVTESLARLISRLLRGPKLCARLSGLCEEASQLRLWIPTRPHRRWVRREGGRAFRDVRGEGDASLELRARVGVGLALARRREVREAVFHLELALSSDSLSPLARPDVYVTLARCYATRGSADRAVELLDRALVELERIAPEEVVTAARLRAARYEVANDPSRGGGRADLEDALERTAAALNAEARAAVYAGTANVRAEKDVAAALGLRRRASALLEVGDEVRELARAHVLCADLLLAEGRPDETGRHLDRAERLFALDGDAVDLGRLRARQARRAVVTGDPARAQELAASAAELLDDHPTEQGEALHALASAQAAAGDFDQAEASFRRAIEQLAAGRRWREAASASRDSAAHLRKAGRTDDALEVMDRPRCSASAAWAPRGPGASGSGSDRVRPCRPQASRTPLGRTELR